MNTTVKDPVCGMEVEPHRFETVYAGIPFAFCSEQCRQRFVAHPHLYIGLPGEKAPRQAGAELLKRRRFRLDTPLAAQATAILTEELEAMMGVKKVEIRGDTVSIVYDLLQATAEQIEARIAEIGIKLGEGWRERLCRSFVHYQEENEAGNLEVQPPHHWHS